MHSGTDYTNTSINHICNCSRLSLIGTPGDREHRRRKPPGRPRGATRSPGELRVIVNLYRGGSNYSPQAVGTALDFIARAARRVNPRIYDAYDREICSY